LTRNTTLPVGTGHLRQQRSAFLFVLLI